MADSKNAKPLYKKEHEPNGFSSAKKAAQNHHNAFAVCGNWGIFRSSSCGRFYYHNSANGASQWEKPRDWTIKPDIDELIALHGGGGGGGSSQREHQTPTAPSSQRPSSSSFPRQQQSASQQVSSVSAKRPQILVQSSRNGDSPHASQNHDQRSASKQPNSSSNNNDLNSMDAPAKRRKQDVSSPGGTPHSSGSGGSGNASSTQNKALSQLSEVLIQQVRDRLDDIKGKLQNPHQTSSQSSSTSSLEKQQIQNKTGSGLSPSLSDNNVQSCRPSANNTRPGSPSNNKAVPMEESDSKTSSDSSTSLQQNRLLADEPFGSMLLRCDRAIGSLDLSAAPPRPQLCELLASASDEMALRFEKQARRLREETVAKYDIVLQTAVQIKTQRSVIRKIDIMSEINAKRVAVIQKQIEELVASRKELASQLRQPSQLTPFTMPPQTPTSFPSTTTASHIHR